MKKLILLFFMLLTTGVISAQVVWEDFEDGGKLEWVAGDGTYNGIVANPDTSGINATASVGSYTKGGGSGFSLFRVQMADPFDISDNNIIRMQVWSPVETEVLLKLEGGGSAIEGRKPIKDSVWTEMVFDFRAQAAATTMTDLLIFFSPGNPDDSSTYLFDNITAGPAPDSMVLEDFEDGPRLNWAALNGTFSGVVENPDTTGINKSMNVGAYTKSNTNAFSLFLHEQTTPIDLSLLNKVKIQIYSPVKSAFILKFEGAGEGKEVRMHIPTANTWREYTMDFSAAADFTTITKVILFFDPGVEESEDTYLFDNLILLPPDDCAGTELDPAVVDNFECQRNATYDNGWDRITSIENPDLSTENSTTHVGQYIKPATEAWAALVADYENAIDLSTLNVLTAKIWSPVVDRVLFKLEGGASPAKEIFIDIPEANKWVDFKVDFSASAAEDHKRVGMFFAAGTPFDTALIFYVDEIIWTEKSVESSILEDFENGPTLAWIPGDGDAANGTFEVTGNPDMGEGNPSDSVGAYSRGTNAFSSLSAILLEPLDLSTQTQLNVDIWAPESATSVTMQLLSPIDGSRDVTRDIPTAGEWTTISFDFAPASAILDFGQINFIFDAESALVGPYYIDNLSLGETTIDVCEGVTPNPNIIDDFECQRNATITVGVADLEVAPNPDISPGNNSAIVGKYTEPDGDFAALVYEAALPFDLSNHNQLNMKIWAPSTVPILFKLEGPSGNQEVFMDVTETETWVNYSVDFSESAGKGFNKLVLFINAGNAATIGEVYYWDDIKWGLAPFESCIANFEAEPFNPTGWIYFANGTFADSTIQVVENPLKDGINTSDNVAAFVESTGLGDGSDNVQPFAGTFLRGETPINFTDMANMNISMDVLMDHEAMVSLKLENGLTVVNAPDNIELYTTPNEWQTVTWSFGDQPNDQFKTISLIFDFENIPAENKTYYFDNIRVTGTDCDGTVSIFSFDPVANFAVTPNPATQAIRIESPETFSRVEIYNTVGQKLITLKDQFHSSTQFDVSTYEPGIYFIQVYNLQGKLAGNAKFIKQ